MSLSVNFPTIRPSLALDFAATRSLDPRITFTRASTAMYYDDHTVAKAEENLFTFSQELDNAAWVKISTTVTANAGAAPDGTNTAELCVPDTATSTKAVRQTFQLTSGLDYAISVFAKASSYDIVQIAGSTGFSLSNYTNFNLTTGVIGNTTGNMNASIVAVGNGWYRISVVIPATSTGGGFVLTTALPSDLASRSPSFAGNGTSGVLLWGFQVEQRSAVTAYTPTTTQPITNYVPQLLTAAAGVARFEHNPVTRESLGLEIEESRTNLVLRSEEFNDAGWVKTRSSITANTIVAPDGTLTADKLVEDTTAANTHDMNRTATVSASTVVTASIYAKAGERTEFALRCADSAGFIGRAFFNLATGALGSRDAGVTSSSIMFVGNGWYRCTATFTTSASGTSANVQPQMAVSGGVSYTGDGYSGMYFWGAQLEAGAFPTSYIPTVASQVTRSADSASMTGTNFSSWYRADEGTLYAEANTPAFATTYVFAEINNNSTSNYIRQSTNSAGTNTQFVVQSNSTITASPGVSVTLGSSRKMAGAYAFNNIQQSVNGSLGNEDTSSEIPTGLVQMNIGSRAVGTSVVNGTIRKLAYYPSRLTNAQLQALTLS